MKLYSKTVSERAAKHQGGNKHLTTTFYVGSTADSREIGHVQLIVSEDNESVSVLYSFGGQTYMLNEVLKPLP